MDKHKRTPDGLARQRERNRVYARAKAAERRENELDALGTQLVMYDRGLDYDSVGAEMRLSRQRVRQLVLGTDEDRERVEDAIMRLAPVPTAPTIPSDEVADLGIRLLMQSDIPNGGSTRRYARHRRRA